MTIEFFIKGLLPGLNEIISDARCSRGKWSSYNTKKQALQHDIFIQIKKQLAPLPVVDSSAYLIFRWIEKNKRRDKDNIAVGKKFILDALVEIGVLTGDGWRQIEGYTDLFSVDSKNFGVSVQIHY